MTYLQRRTGRFLAAAGSILLGCVVVSAQALVRSYPLYTSAYQEICPLTLAQAPELRSFDLGITVEQLKARFPGIKIKRADEFGVSEVTFVYREGVDRPRAAGFGTYALPKSDFVAMLTLDLIDGRVSRISLIYNGPTEWNTADEFVAAISGLLGLSGVWRPLNLPKNRLECSGFRITAAVTNVEGRKRSSLVLNDLAAEQVVEDRKKQKQDHRDPGHEAHGGMGHEKP